MTDPITPPETSKSSKRDPDFDSILLYRSTGHQRHLRDIYNRNHQTLQNRMAAAFSHSNVDPEEISQIAFSKAFNKLDTFRGEAKFSTWLYRIARNVGYDLYRAHSKQEEREVASLDNDHFYSLDHTNHLADFTYDPENRDIDSILADALRCLNPQQRTILLETARGIPAQQLSDRLGIAPGTIKSSLHRARANITRNITANPEDMHPHPAFYFSKLGDEITLNGAITRLSNIHQETFHLAMNTTNYSQLAKSLDITERQARVRVLKTVDALTPLIVTTEQSGEVLVPELLHPHERLHLQRTQERATTNHDHGQIPHNAASQENTPEL